MNALRNQVTLVGHLGKDVDFRTVGDNRGLAQFTLATNEYYKNNKGELIKETQWHNIKAWGKTAENMNTILSKGDEVMVQGKLTYRNYEDGDGRKHYFTEVIISSFIKLTRKEAVAA